MLRLALSQKSLQKILDGFKSHDAHKETAKAMLPDIVTRERNKAQLLDPTSWFVNPRRIISNAIHDVRAINMEKCMVHQPTKKSPSIKPGPSPVQIFPKTAKH